MFELFNKSAQLLPVKVSKNEDKIAPTISDPQLLAQKRNELKELVRKAAEDGEITQMEYDELCELTVQVGINDFELNEMVRAEYKKALVKKVKLFVGDDGKVDESEMKDLMFRAKEIGVGVEDLKSCIQEAVTQYKIQYEIEEKKRRAAKEKRLAEQRKEKAEQRKEKAEQRKENMKKIGDRAAKLGKILLGVGVAAGAAYVGLKVQSNRANNLAAMNGTYKVSLSTVMHKSAKG